jgi:hypothetical protein
MKKNMFVKGDFVRFKRKDPEKNGIVIDVHQTNSFNSKHTDHIINSYPYVYYVLVEGNHVEGPYFSDELLRVN